MSPFKFPKRERGPFRITGNYIAGVSTAIVPTFQKDGPGIAVSTEIRRITGSGIATNSYDFFSATASNSNTTVGYMTVRYDNEWYSNKNPSGRGRVVGSTLSTSISANLGIIGGGGNGSWGGGGGGGVGHGAYDIRSGVYEIQIGGGNNHTYIKHIYNPDTNVGLGRSITANSSTQFASRTGGSSGTVPVYGFNPTYYGGGVGRDPQAPGGAGGGGGGGTAGGGNGEFTNGDSGNGGGGVSYSSATISNIFLNGGSLSGGGGGGGQTYGDQGGGGNGGSNGGGSHGSRGQWKTGGGGGGGGGGGTGRLVIKFTDPEAATVGRGNTAIR